MNKLSVIVPVYNVANYVSDCIESIIHQSYKNIEIILVDDGSTDKSGSICDKYALKDSRIKVIHKKNGGLSDARNAGTMKATGDYLFYIDSDDFLGYLEAIEDAMKILNVENLDLIMFGHVLYYENSKKEKYSQLNINVNSNSFSDVLLECTKNGIFPVTACGKIIKTSIAKKFLFKKGYLSEDIEWFCRISNIITTCRWLNKPIYFYRQRENSITTTHNINKLYFLMEYIETLAPIVSQYKNPIIKQCLLSGLAYEYVIAIGMSALYKKDSKYETIINKLKSYKSILKYDSNPKTKICKMIISVFGIKNSSYLLSIRIKMTKGM